MKIEEAAAKRQAQIDSGQETIIGVNNYQLKEEEAIEILDIDNTKVRQKQIERLQELKQSRDEKTVQKALEAFDKSSRNR